MAPMSSSPAYPHTATSLAFLNHSYSHVTALFPNLPWLPIFYTISSLSSLPLPFSPFLSFRPLSFKIFAYLPAKHLMARHTCRAQVHACTTEMHTSVPIWSGVVLRELAVLTLVTVGAGVPRVALTGPIAAYSTVAYSMHTAAHCRQKRGIFRYLM